MTPIVKNISSTSNHIKDACHKSLHALNCQRAVLQFILAKHLPTNPFITHVGLETVMTEAQDMALLKSGKLFR